MRLQLIWAWAADGQPETTLSVAGDELTHDGVAYDLSAVPEGGEGIPAGQHPFAGPIRRIGGVIHASVITHLGLTAAADQPTDPAHWLVDVPAGPVTLPAIRKELAE